MPRDPSENQPASPQSTGLAAAMPPAVRQRLQRCFERGKEVLRQEKPDRDYAHTMFTECVLNDPGNLEYVEALLDNLQRKYKNNKRGASFRGFGGRGGFKKAVQAEDWGEVFRSGLDLLRTNPWDVPTLRALASACQANHYNEVELRYLKNALDVNRKDVEVNRHCAESLARMGQFDQAIACWHRIEELDKSNDEARRKISELSLARTRGVAGLEPAAPSGSARPSSPERPSGAAPRASAPPTSGQEPAVTPKSSGTAAPSASPSKLAGATPAESPASSQNSTGDAPEQRIRMLQQQLQQDEANLDTYVALAAAQTDAGQLRDAFQTLKRALEASGGNHLPIRELMEDAQIRMIRSQVAVAEKRAAAEKTDEAQDLARRFRVELNRQELLVYSQRCDRYPQDAKLRFELAVRLKRDGNFREARAAFDAARAEPSLRAMATHEMGECLQQLKQYAQALKCYQVAAQEAEAGDEVQLLALYRTAVLASALKNLELSRDSYMRILERAPNYRDVRDRLDKLIKIGDKE